MDAKNFTIVVGGDTVDVTLLEPFKQKDKKALKRDPQYGIEFNKLSDLDDEKESKFALYVLRKLRPQTTLEEVDELPVKTVQDLILYSLKKSGEVDGPFSQPLTSSPASTDGQGKM